MTHPVIVVLLLVVDTMPILILNQLTFNRLKQFIFLTWKTPNFRLGTFHREKNYNRNKKNCRTFSSMIKTFKYKLHRLISETSARLSVASETTKKSKRIKYYQFEQYNGIALELLTGFFRAIVDIPLPTTMPYHRNSFYPPRTRIA
jgi:hypothetical protein